MHGLGAERAARAGVGVRAEQVDVPRPPAVGQQAVEHLACRGSVQPVQQEGAHEPGALADPVGEGESHLARRRVGLGVGGRRVAEEGDEIPHHHQPVSLRHRAVEAGQRQLRFGLGHVPGLPGAPAVRAAATEDAFAQPAQVVAAVEHREPEPPVAARGRQPQLEVRLVLQPSDLARASARPARSVRPFPRPSRPGAGPAFPPTGIVSSLAILIPVTSAEAGAATSSAAVKRTNITWRSGIVEPFSALHGCDSPSDPHLALPSTIAA